MNTQEIKNVAEYFTLRDTISKKLTSLIKYKIISNDTAENIYNDILFDVMDLYTENHTYDTEYCVMQLISLHVVDYCTHTTLVYRDDNFRKIYQTLIYFALGELPSNVKEYLNIDDEEFFSILNFLVDNNFIMRVKGRDKDLCLY